MTEGFNAVEWMRARREQIDSEDERLAWREKSSKTLELLENDPLWQRFESRLANRPDAAASASSPDPRAR